MPTTCSSPAGSAPTWRGSPTDCRCASAPRRRPSTGPARASGSGRRPAPSGPGRDRHRADRGAAGRRHPLHAGAPRGHRGGRARLHRRGLRARGPALAAFPVPRRRPVRGPRRHPPRTARIADLHRRDAVPLLRARPAGRGGLRRPRPSRGARFARAVLAAHFGPRALDGLSVPCVTAWRRDPFARASWAVVPPGLLAIRDRLEVPTGERIWFAGAALSRAQWGTAGGAWESGERAAEGVARALDAPPAGVSGPAGGATACSAARGPAGGGRP